MTRLLLTSSLSGEQCRIRNTSVATGARRLEEFEIGCAGWEEPSGFIWRMPQIGRANLAEMLTDDDLPLWQIRAVSCGALEDAGGGAAPTLVRRCSSEEGWLACSTMSGSTGRRSTPSATRCRSFAR